MASTNKYSWGEISVKNRYMENNETSKSQNKLKVRFQKRWIILVKTVYLDFLKRNQNVLSNQYPKKNQLKPMKKILTKKPR